MDEEKLLTIVPDNCSVEVCVFDIMHANLPYIFPLITPWQVVRAYKQIKFTIFRQVGKSETSESVYAWCNISKVPLVMF